MEVGTSSEMPRRKGKYPMAQSPCRQPDATIVVPHIPKGVQAMPSLIRYMERLQYLDHDVVDAGKFPEFTQQVYLDSIGTGPFGDPVI
jgi:hypothetical protein